MLCMFRAVLQRMGRKVALFGILCASFVLIGAIILYYWVPGPCGSPYAGIFISGQYNETQPEDLPILNGSIYNTTSVNRSWYNERELWIQYQSISGGNKSYVYEVYFSRKDTYTDYTLRPHFRYNRTYDEGIINIESTQIISLFEPIIGRPYSIHIFDDNWGCI